MLLTLSSMMTASAYVPLVREGVRWVNYHRDYKSNTSVRPIPFLLYYNEFVGDTIINDIQYKKLYCWSDEVDHILIDHGYLSRDTPFLFAREENGIVEFLPNYDSLIDYLGYDRSNPDNCKNYVDQLFGRYGVSENGFLAYNFSEPSAMMKYRGFDSITYIGDTIVADESCKVYEASYDYVYVDRYYEWDLFCGNAEDHTNGYIIEGIGFVSLGYGTLFSVANHNIVLMMAPRCTGLSRVEDAEGNIIFKGPYYGLFYDQNFDRVVDAADVNLLIYQLLGKPISPRLFDVTMDDRVDGADLNAIIGYILGEHGEPGEKWPQEQ